MRERLENIGRHIIGEPALFVLATAIGLMARGSERVREDWHKVVVNDAFQNGGVVSWRRWSLMFLKPEDRRTVYKDIGFVLETAKE